MAETGNSPTPAYKQFWPYVVFGLPLVAVVAGIATVVIAFNHQDSLVRDDWYKDGVAVNRRLAADERARTLGIGAQLRVDSTSGEVDLLLAGRGSEALATLELELSHATHANRDRVLRLQRVEHGVYRGRLERDLTGRWYATLRPEASGDPLAAGASDWRLSGRLELPMTEALAFGERQASERAVTPEQGP